MEVVSAMDILMSAYHYQERQKMMERYENVATTILIDYSIVFKIYAGCNCQHLTDGPNCEMCQPLYNNAEYMRGTTTNASVCQS